jgi:lipoprotein-anchoring transpeptidase ErfK/SrfK
MNAVASFGIATGMAAYPTPTGNFRIATKQRNPWWYPPAADWAKGAKPVPPGPGNPLGTRWMGLNVGAVGIHGTPDAASIGYSASHGCIRMRISDAEWLFERVRVGTPVFIRSA